MERRLHELQSRMKQLQGQASQLHSVLAPLPSLQGCMPPIANLLPTPLYIAYNQFVATSIALQEPCRASIRGSAEAAAALQAQSAHTGGQKTYLLHQAQQQHVQQNGGLFQVWMGAIWHAHTCQAVLQTCTQEHCSLKCRRAGFALNSQQRISGHLPDTWKRSAWHFHAH